MTRLEVVEQAGGYKGRVPVSQHDAVEGQLGAVLQTALRSEHAARLELQGHQGEGRGTSLTSPPLLGGEGREGVGGEGGGEGGREGEGGSSEVVISLNICVCFC